MLRVCCGAGDRCLLGCWACGCWCNPPTCSRPLALPLQTSGNKTAREKKAAEVEANVHKQFGRYMEKHNLLAGVKGVREVRCRSA